MTASTRTGVLCAALAYLSWGLFPLYFRMIATVPAAQVVAHRTLWSLGVVGLLLLVLRRWAWLRGLDARTVARFGLSAALIAVNWLVYVWAVGHGHVLDASLGYFINPLVNVALGYLVLKERLRPAQWGAIALAAAGVLWLTWQLGHAPWVALALAVSFGLYGLLRKTATLGALEGLTLETLLLAPLAGAALAWWTVQGTSAATDTATWLWLLGTGPLTAGSLLLFAAGARRIPLSTLGLIQYLSPSLQFACGLWVFHEPLNSARLAGFVLIWSALAVYTAEGLLNQRRLRTA
jgi:chloramphenicol-sensitive protein RarD